jgi:hypothetical protein
LAGCGESGDPNSETGLETSDASGSTTAGVTTDGTDESGEADTNAEGDAGDGDAGDTTDETETTGPDSPYGRVSGTLYEDLNGNGTRDDGEPGVKSHRIFIDLNNDGFWQKDEPYDVTNMEGGYLFDELVPGLFRIYLEPYKDIQTEPADITEVVEDFESGMIDMEKFSFTGDGITVVNGALQITRNSVDDTIEINDQFEGSLDVQMKIRWESQADPDSFNGVRVIAPCEEGSPNKAGMEVGRERYGGQWQIRVYNCTSTYPSYQYTEVMANLGTDYDLRAWVREGAMGVSVDGVHIWDADSGVAGPYTVTFPGYWDEFATTGAGAVSVIDDLAVRGFVRLPQDHSVYAGDNITDANFGRVTIAD